MSRGKSLKWKVKRGDLETMKQQDWTFLTNGINLFGEMQQECKLEKK